MSIKILLGLMIFLCLNNHLFAQEEGVLQTEKPKPSMGLSVQPGGLLIQYVKPGERYDLYEKSGIALVIENRDDQPHTYTLTTSKPSQVGNKIWLRGYSEIPDPSWFWFEKNEVTIEPQGKEEVKMFLKVPEEERYYNQHWTVSLGITSKPEKGQMLALAVYPRYQIETESKAGLKERPDGLIGFEPNMLLFEGLISGKKQSSKIVIYNNDERTHKYRITCRIIEIDPTRERIVNSPGYSWIPNIEWIRLDKKSLFIRPGQSKELVATVNVPKEIKHSEKRWEALIFVEPEEGAPGFVRVGIILA